MPQVYVKNSDNGAESNGANELHNTKQLWQPFMPTFSSYSNLEEELSPMDCMTVNNFNDTHESRDYMGFSIVDRMGSPCMNTLVDGEI